MSLFLAGADSDTEPQLSVSRDRWDKGSIKLGELGSGILGFWIGNPKVDFLARGIGVSGLRGDGFFSGVNANISGGEC